MHKTKPIIAIVIVLILGGSIFAYSRRNAALPRYETIKVIRTDIREEVAATGQVAPAKTFNLQFENTGMIKSIAVKVGDIVKAGAVLAKLDTRDLETKVAQDEASLAQAQAKLAIAREGTRPEELDSVKNTLRSAEIALQDAKANLDAVTAKAESDLADTYEDGRIAYLNNLLTLGNIREDVRAIYLSPPSKFSESDTQAKNSFNAEYLVTDAVYAMARAHLDALSSNPTRDEIVLALAALSAAASQMSQMLDLTNRALAATDSAPAATKTTIATDITNLKTLLTAVTDARAAITNMQAANTITVNTAQTTYNAALAKVESAKKDLALKEAGSRPSEIQQLEAAVAQARAVLLASRVNLQKSQLISPIDGVVSAVSLEVGEIARAGSAAVTLITQSGFQIDMNVPEVDIPKIAVGAEADITLDAFGTEKHFLATVSIIDPAQTEAEGVVYYKVTVLFKDATEQVRPGMTANVTVFGREAKNALVIPQRAAQELDGKKIVRVLANGVAEDRDVTLGLRSAKGDVEVRSGLQEDDEVIVFEKKK